MNTYAYRHASMEWGEKIAAWLIEIEMLTPRELYLPACFKFAVLEHMSKSLCKDIDIILESIRRVVIMGIDFRQSFYVIRAVEKLTIDWKGQVPFLKITEILLKIMMIYSVSPESVMNVAVVLERNFRINSDSFNEEINSLNRFLPVARIVGVSFEEAISEYKYLILTGADPTRAAIDIYRKYVRIAREADAVKIGIITKIKKAIINKVKLIIRRARNGMHVYL